jgi:hypothetical protein
MLLYPNINIRIYKCKDLKQMHNMQQLLQYVIGPSTQIYPSGTRSSLASEIALCKLGP